MEKLFDPQIFLAKVGVGRSILKFERMKTNSCKATLPTRSITFKKGKIKLTVISKHNKEAAVGVLGGGQFFGEGCMNGHPMRIATPTAMESCLRQSQSRP